MNGVSYIRSRDAARIVGLAPDYVSRLAREGLIQGRQVDRVWFVDLPTLKAFVAEQERQKATWRAELAPAPRRATPRGPPVRAARGSRLMYVE
jgi:hypothetical protein